MSALSGIEQATGQSFPPLFKQLHAADRLSWGAPHPEWSEVVFPTLQADPPVLLYAYDYEPIARERRALPWVRIDKGYVFDTPDGLRTLTEVDQVLASHGTSG